MAYSPSSHLHPSEHLHPYLLLPPPRLYCLYWLYWHISKFYTNCFIFRVKEFNTFTLGWTHFLQGFDADCSNWVFDLFLFCFACYLQASWWTSVRGKLVRCQRPTLFVHCLGCRSALSHLPTRREKSGVSLEDDSSCLSQTCYTTNLSPHR